MNFQIYPTITLPRSLAQRLDTNLNISEKTLFHSNNMLHNTNVGIQSWNNLDNKVETTRIGYSAYTTDLAVGIGAFSQAQGVANTVIGTSAEARTDKYNQILIGFNVDGAEEHNSIRLGNNDIEKFYCEANLTVTSDKRTKNDIKPSELGLDFISQLKPVTFRKINPQDYPKEILDNRFTRKERIAARPEDNTNIYEGLVAQDVEEVLHKLDETWSGHTINSYNGKQGIQYSTLTMPLINAVKTLKEQNEQLTARIIALENK